MRHNPPAIVLLVILALGLAGSARPQPAITSQFAFRTHFWQGKWLPYRLFVPDSYSPLQQYPLMLTLHGSGERGANNKAQIDNYRIATVWADPVNQAIYPCLVVSPQCPESASWSGDMLLAVNDLLDSLQREFSVDPNRLYVTGLSMGGFGAWELIDRFPGRFAAAVPMSGGGNALDVAPMMDQAIWNFHGELDTSVPVELSRFMMQAFEAAGRPVLYTGCEYGDCRGVSQAEVLRRVQNHTDLLYTEVDDGGHVMWDQAYDYPPLLPWVFSQVRRDTSRLRLTGLTTWQRVSGEVGITWRSSISASRLELWFHGAPAAEWQRLAELPQTGIWRWNTAAVADGALARLRLYAFDAGGRIIAWDQSAPFTVDNAGNGLPYANIRTPIWSDQPLVERELALACAILDAETDPVNAAVDYSSDDGRTWQPVGSVYKVPDTSSVVFPVNLEALPNSLHARLRLQVSDGTSIAIAATRSFRKLTPRLDSLKVLHIAGSSGASIQAMVSSGAELNGERYRIEFSNQNGVLTWSVLYSSSGVRILENIPVEATALESPLFDGLTLRVADANPARPDMDNSGWSQGTATLRFNLYLQDYRIGGVMRKSNPQPSDYRITFSDQFIDTSAAAFGIPPVPIRFRVRDITRDRPVKVLFVDTNRDQMLSRLEYIYLVEPDSSGQPRITWSIGFTGDSTAVLPRGGDELTLRTLKPLSTADIYEFRAVASGVAVNQAGVTPAAQAVVLRGTHPNPFNASTTIVYELGRDEKEVCVEIYNLLGQRVRLLFSGGQKAGRHELVWDGRDGSGRVLPSGLYPLILRAGGLRQVKTMVMVR